MHRSICFSRHVDERGMPRGVRGRWVPRLHVWPAYDGLDPISFSLERTFDLDERVVDEWGTLLAAAVDGCCRELGVAVYTFRPHARSWLGGRGLRWDLAHSPDYYALTADAINVRQRTAHDEVVHLLAGTLEPAVIAPLRRLSVLDAGALLEHGPMAIALVPEAPRAVVACRRIGDEQRFLACLAEAGQGLGYVVTAC